MAKKIAKDGLDDNKIKDDTNEIMKAVFNNPELIRDLDLEEFSEHLAKDKNKENMLFVLEFI